MTDMASSSSETTPESKQETEPKIEDIPFVDHDKKEKNQ